MKKHLLAITLMFSTTLCFAQYLQKQEALKDLEDLEEFKVLMEKEPSYY